MKKSRVQLYTDQKGKWRWRMFSKNGNVIANSGQGYTQRYNALSGLRAVCRACKDWEELQSNLRGLRIT